LQRRPHPWSSIVSANEPGNGAATAKIAQQNNRAESVA
jgi:hypothetical protein